MPRLPFQCGFRIGADARDYVHICPGIVSPILSVLQKVHDFNYICTGITIAWLKNGELLSKLRDRTTGHNNLNILNFFQSARVVLSSPAKWKNT